MLSGSLFRVTGRTYPHSRDKGPDVGWYRRGKPVRVPDAAAIVQIFQRGRRLWRSNPALFYDRLWSYLRSPTWGLHELIETPRRSKRIQESYEAWLQCRQAAGITADSFSDGPLLSVIMPVFNTPEDVLRAAILSVLQQTYGNWELCIADDASSEPHVRSLLADYEALDSRVVVVRRAVQGHISAASNSAIDRARGEFVVLLDHDDELAPSALKAVADAIQREPSVDFLYSDEEKLDFDGSPVEPFFKPAWSPTLLACGNYVTHLAAMRRTTVVRVGGFRDEMVGSQDHDLFLRVTEQARSVAHIPQVLYSWRKSTTSTAVATSAKPYAIEAARRALQSAIDRRGTDGILEPSHLNGLFAVRTPLRAPVRVSVIVRGSAQSWVAGFHSPDIQVCDVTSIDGTSTAGTIARAINEGTGEFLLFVDADELPDAEDAVSRLLASAQTAGIGVVGGMTVHREKGEILQAGIAFTPEGQPFYAFMGASVFPQRNFYLNLKDLPREVSATSQGCSALRRSTWDVMGGWSCALPAGLALYDLCLRALAAGYTNIYTPSARFVTDRRLPAIPTVTDWPWPWINFSDPFWNPNLSPFNPDGLPFRCDGSREPRVRPGFSATALGPGAGRDR